MRAAPPAPLPDAWWCATTAATQAAPDAGAAGLAADRARERLERYGPNRFLGRPARPLWLAYLAHFRNPLVLVLLAAAAIEAATGEPIGALIVIALVVASVTIDFVQEQRAGRADGTEVDRPRAWDMKFVRDFRWTIGPVSSLFDFLTVYLLLAWLDAGEKLFQTGWFVGSMATQVPVIFVVRTRGRPWASLPSPWLAVTSIAIVAIAALLPLTPLGRHFGFVAPPWEFYALVAALTTVYFAVVEAVKRRFLRWHAAV